jgi:hypothetical protein
LPPRWPAAVPREVERAAGRPVRVPAGHLAGRETRVPCVPAHRPGDRSTSHAAVLRLGHGWGAAEGRWDLPSPEGACYLADDEVVSVLEVLVPDLPPSGPPRLVADTWLRRRRRIEIAARADSGPYADLDAEEACGFGVAGDLHTTDDRSLTQRWAVARGASVALHDDAALLHRLRDHDVEVLPVPNEVDAD